MSPHANPDRWKTRYRIDPDGCWRWTGSLDKNGYGQFDVFGQGHRKNWRAHRWVYTQLVRQLSDTETLDHLCRNHECVNPAHLDPVPHAENVRRGNAGLHNAVKTHCSKGHPFSAENTRVTAEGWRYCRTCSNAAALAAGRKKRGTLPGAVHNKFKTHCKYGHEFTPENTVKIKTGRACRECRRTFSREYMRKKRSMT